MQAGSILNPAVDGVCFCHFSTKKGDSGTDVPPLSIPLALADVNELFHNIHQQRSISEGRSLGSSRANIKALHPSLRIIEKLCIVELHMDKPCEARGLFCSFSLTIEF